ncbi:zinc metallopeptidase [Paludicola sp. MB14-C6]|uniref:zinc metallopeptidase n=1 Tax=Paludihabitans sp. MB14-C6 TaxID=3070656 RepID=UPI0027DB0502|nr:zinc metallopeptidase [Paludicola sp. MB14-C6]WMJ22379.1 zinc metallopeptidase [Paludicola sp. MB14-C6]
MPFFWYDQYYLFLVVPAALIALWAQIKVKTTFNKYSGYHAARGYTAAMVARQILDENGLQNVRIEHICGNLSDHFDPRSNVIRLSDSVYNSTSVASIGVAAHEVGHAIQYAKNYAPIKFRAALIPITQLGSSIAIPLAIFGFAIRMDWLMTFGILLFSAVVLFQLITLPVEFNASARAIKTLETDMILDEIELQGAKKVLTAAALTYVAALLVAIANLVRLLLLRNRDD